MEADLVNELRYAVEADPWDSTLCGRAADEIERLRSQVENLKAHIQWLTQVAQERFHG